MAKKPKVVKIVPGTVEYERQQYFEREKAEYEKRTGEKVAWELDHPLTSTPLPAEVEDERQVAGDESPEPAEDETGEAQGDE